MTHPKDGGATTQIYAEDDLMTRAEKIVAALGFRGAVGGYAINVYRILQAYEKADERDRG